MPSYSLGGLPQSLLCFEVTCYLIVIPKYFIALICTFLLLYTYKTLTNMIPHQNMAFQHNLNMQFQVMITHIWSRIYYILFPLRQQLHFFCIDSLHMLGIRHSRCIYICVQNWVSTLKTIKKKKLIVSWIIAIYSSKPLEAYVFAAMPGPCLRSSDN